MTAGTTPGLLFEAPAGLVTRGTVLVVPGRGESPASYHRFGSRLAADAYEVRVAPRFEPHADLGAYAEQLGRVLDGHTATPLVAVGADTGALAVAALAGAGRLAADAVVLAGVPAQAAAAPATWDDELELRSACPTHRKVLSEDQDVARGALSTEVPDGLVTAAFAAPAPVPHLVLRGSHDPLPAGPELGAYLAQLASVQVVEVVGAHHDVLNDLQHRSVAATVVTYLEQLRLPDPSQVIVREVAR